jgi:hypothetical protein
MDKVIKVLMIPLVLLNTLGSVVATVWLAILGQWGVLGGGLLISIFGAFWLSLIMIPGLLLAAPAMWFAERGQQWGVIAFGALSLLYTYIVIAVWSLGTLWFFIAKAHGMGDAVPLMLLGYAVATAPLSFMASKEQDSEETHVTLFVAELALVAVIAVLLLFRDVRASVAVFAGIMLLGYGFQMWLAIQLDRTEQSARGLDKTLSP